MSIDLDIPNPWDFNIDADMSGNMGISIHELPVIHLDLEPIEIKPLDVSMAMDIKPLAVSMEIKPIDMSFRLKEVPSVRAHFPVDYKVCFGFFGLEVASIRFCGQAQIISEPYVPNPCEFRVQRLPQPDPQTQPIP